MYKVEGYEFETKEMEAAAKREVEGIKYIRAKTRMDNPQVVLNLYNSLVLKEVFSTPIGFDFLNELRVFLLSSPQISDESIYPIPVHLADFGKTDRKDAKGSAKARKEAHRKSRELQKTVEITTGRRASAAEMRYRRKYHISLFFLVVCVMIIIGMFIITYVSGESITILNYENALIDKYESWQESLEERETKLKQREKQLQLEQEHGSQEMQQ